MITVSAKEFSDAVSTISGLARFPNVVDVYVRLRLEDDKFHVHGEIRDTRVNFALDYSGDDEINVEILLADLKNVSKNIKSGKLQFYESSEKVHLVYNGMEFQIAKAVRDQLLATPEFEDVAHFTKGDSVTLLTGIPKAISSSTFKAIECLCLSSNGNTFFAAGADGFRMHVVSEERNFKPFSALIDFRNVGVMRKMFSSEEFSLAVNHFTNIVKFHSRNKWMTCRNFAAEANFPDYNRIIEKITDTTDVDVYVPDIISVVRTAAAAKSDGILKFEVADGAFSVMLVDQELNKISEPVNIPADVTGNDTVSHYNVQYMLNALECCSFDVLIKLAKGCCRLHSDSFTGVVMGISVRES